jgi:hypothetical protein
MIDKPKGWKHHDQLEPAAMMSGSAGTLAVMNVAMLWLPADGASL